MPDEFPGADELVTLVIVEPFHVNLLVHGVEGWEPVDRKGVRGPASRADEVIAVAAAAGLKVERR